jgi:hypothetical protein
MNTELRRALAALIANWHDRGLTGLARELWDAALGCDQPCHQCGESVPAERRWPAYQDPTCFSCLPSPPALPALPPNEEQLCADWERVLPTLGDDEA